jgi:3-carboxy-cis,cis-muconate cycloisomerase
VAGLELIFADERCARALSDEQLLAAMARFEAGLALASARVGLVSLEDARIIGRVCETARFETAALAHAARQAGTLAIPFVKELKAQVAAVSQAAARHVHAGATSQDVMDTGMVLCLRPASVRIVELLARLGDAAAALARRYQDAPTAARTLLQPALPVPFGYKAAVWLSMLERSYRGFSSAADGACVLQFGGAAGTLSAFGDRATAIEAALAEELQLARPVAPWHSVRDALARFGCEASILTGAAGKIARDVSLLMQPEIGEAAEPAPGGSSSMPHKRNPSGSLLALEAAQRAPALAGTLLNQLTSEHERGIGQWQSQWFTLRELLCATSSALAAMGEVLQGLQVDVGAMRANIERSAIPAEERQRGFGAARAMIERTLEAWQSVRAG